MSRVACRNAPAHKDAPALRNALEARAVRLCRYQGRPTGTISNLTPSSIIRASLARV